MTSTNARCSRPYEEEYSSDILSVPLLEQYDRVRERNRDNNKITETKKGAI